jgi:hypothetical protein
LVTDPGVAQCASDFFFLELNMEDYQERVIAEKEELHKKVCGLIDFMHCDTYAQLPATEQGLLMVQLAAMQNYESALERRIELF